MSVKTQYGADELLFRAKVPAGAPGVVNRVTAADAGWSHLSAEIRRLAPGASFEWNAAENEAVFVVLGGQVDVNSNHGEWKAVGERASVYEGMPSAVFLPASSKAVFTAGANGAEVAFAWAKAEAPHPARVIRPADVKIEIRGGHSNSRQINQIVPPGFPASRIVCVEVFTPSGNWSSYPPHKHDTHVANTDGSLVEGDLEEFYCYKFRQPGAFALQRIYTADGSTDATLAPRDGDIVLVPFGYHPVSAPYGYDCYYLNFLAGSAQTLAATDDPEHAWVKDTWTAVDPRVPMVSGQTLGRK